LNSEPSGCSVLDCSNTGITDLSLGPWRLYHVLRVACRLLDPSSLSKEFKAFVSCEASARKGMWDQKKKRTRVLSSIVFCCYCYGLPYIFETTCRWGARGGTVGWGTALQAERSWVRFPMVLLDFLQWHNPSGPSGRTMALGLTQPLTEMSTRNVSWGKGGRCVGLTTLPHLCAFNLGASTSWNPQGLWALG
jgi:hypothetical protein